VPRQSQHLIGHIQTVSLAVGPDAAGGEKHVDAAARAQIEHRFAGL
jgi:hypothetical protein